MSTSTIPTDRPTNDGSVHAYREAALAWGDTHAIALSDPGPRTASEQHILLDAARSYVHDLTEARATLDYVEAVTAARRRG